MDGINEQAAMAPRLGELVRFHFNGTTDRRCGTVSSSSYVGADGRVWVWVVDQNKPSGAYRVPVQQLERGCPAPTKTAAR